jgi:hypothetical protein
MEKIMIKKIELREYKLESNDIDDDDDDSVKDDSVKDDSVREQKHQQHSTTNYGSFYSIFLHVITDQGEIEVDYLGKLTKDKDKFDECFNFLCNYQGISSTLNRLILEIKNNIL